MAKTTKKKSTATKRTPAPDPKDDPQNRKPPKDEQAKRADEKALRDEQKAAKGDKTTKAAEREERRLEMERKTQAGSIVGRNKGKPGAQHAPAGSERKHTT